MKELAEFLAEQRARDEAVARAANPGTVRLTREELEAALEAALAQRDEEERHKGSAIRQWMKAASQLDAALAKLAAVRGLCDEGDAVPVERILRALDGDS